jgi:hypothetical protein
MQILTQFSDENKINIKGGKRLLRSPEINTLNYSGLSEKEEKINQQTTQKFTKNANKNLLFRARDNHNTVSPLLSIKTSQTIVFRQLRKCFFGSPKESKRGKVFSVSRFHKFSITNKIFSFYECTHS